MGPPSTEVQACAFCELYGVKTWVDFVPGQEVNNVDTKRKHNVWRCLSVKKTAESLCRECPELKIAEVLREIENPGDTHRAYVAAAAAGH